MRGNFDSSAPIFQQIVDAMLSDIARGVLAPGARVPPVRQLAAEYKVNPNTMQKSLEKLGDAGYLYTERTSGRYVTDDASKIAKLREKIPNDMTATYVRDMLDFGVSADGIIEHVERRVKNEKGN